MAERTRGAPPAVCEAVITLAPAFPPVESGWNSHPVLPPAWASALTEATVTSSLNQPATATLTFHDPGHRLPPELGTRLGTAIKIAFRTSQEAQPVRLFTGEITAIESTREDSTSLTVLHAQDLGHRLTHTRRVRNLDGKTVQTILTELTTEHGLDTSVPEPLASRNVTTLTQPNTTNWELLQELALLHTCALTIRDKTLTLAPPTSPNTAPDPRTTTEQHDNRVLRYGENLLTVHATVQGPTLSSTIEVRSWDPDKGQILTRTQTAATSADFSKNTITAQHTATDTQSGTTPTVIPALQLTSPEDISSTAAALAAHHANSLVQLELTTTGTPTLTTGTPITLTGLGSPFTGRYTTTTLQHTLTDNGYRTHLTVTPLHPAPHTPAYPLTSPAPVPGLANATVAALPTKNDPQGHVRLRFPWLDNDYLTGWTRVLQHNHGSYTLPAQNQEVLVGFLTGRLDQPIVLGYLYNNHSDTNALPQWATEPGTLTYTNTNGTGLHINPQNTLALTTTTKDGKTSNATITLNNETGEIEITGKAVKIKADNIEIN
ncbi:VgrG-related protein [Streptomyces sp. NPDC051555]|uniref:VgrG-related protein n=1 Tax=Streptomyces sp. NPDC051555 TaxID=3365657 RepID=UPI003796E60A